ncbi:family 78 glycoside hydrolase catalytic domain [Actinoallomurus sp. NPDC052308]|uniref:family 78 glycoside hydrolase catalytic domain n=1 Tax=Actinoallomurus sp. NPDC052308 TaxID=3155530 RepID=UPI00341A306E
MKVTDVRFEHHREALGIGVHRPRVSWTTVTDATGWRQTVRQIQVLDEAGTVVWDTGREKTGESVLVPWPAPPLGSRDRRRVRVRVWGPDDAGPSPWSEAVPVEAGLLRPGDWTAAFVTGGADRLLRHGFDLRDGFVSARLYATALGVYEIELNGARVGDHVLAPGWTSYRNRLRYQTYDITDLLRPGPNALGALLGDGWYHGRLGWADGSAYYGDEVALLAQLEVRYADGTIDRVGTGPGWTCAPGPIVTSDLYDGERHDARAEPPGWSMPGFDDEAWRAVRVVAADPARLVGPDGPPVRRTEALEPVAVTESPDGHPILDFGQNIAGRLRIRVSGPAGRVVTLRHAEVLDERGGLCVRPLRTARATDEYVLRGTGIEEWEPRFTYHGFRYAEVRGWPGTLDPADVRAVVCHTDMTRTGRFTCSDPMLNRLHENAVWSMRGNFVDLPTDCPQRDERFGWTGDAQVFAPAAAFLYACGGLFASWLTDLAAEQHDDGLVPPYVPYVKVEGDGAQPAAAWGDAAVIVPWTMYRRFGDRDVLRRQYPSMRAWVDGIAALAGDRYVWDTGFQFGDWLDPAAPPDRPDATRTPHGLVATAYLAYSAGLVARTAEVLGETADRERYDDLAGRVRAAFRAKYQGPDGRLTGDSQTGYALALGFGLLEDAASRRAAGRRLAEVVRRDGHRIGTGFVGTPLVCDALCDAGEHETAYRLVLQRACPSWLYQVTMGATTIWERWDSLLPDGTVNPGTMTSFNHYAYGAVADWLHRVVAGLAPDEPGYRRLLVHPRPGGGLTHASATLDTPYGRAEAGWRLLPATRELQVEVLVPPNATARVILPAGETTDVTAGRHTFRAPFG